jgi:hypothetical protein
MRDYAKVPPDFWIGEVGKRLRSSPEAQLVALYLQTNPHANALGLYYLPIPFIAHETGLGTEGAREGLRRCIEADFCGYDEDAEVVWVHGMAAVQLAETLKAEDKRAKWAAGAYRTLPENRFLAAFFDRYSTAFHLEDRRGTGGASEPDRRGFEGAPEGHRSQEQEKEQEKEKENLLDPHLAAGVTRPRGDESSENEDRDSAPPEPAPTVRTAPRKGALAAYVAAWTERYGFSPTPQEQDIISANRALKPFEPTEREAIVRAFVADDLPWLAANGHRLGLLPKELDRLRAKLAGTLSGGRKRPAGEWTDCTIPREGPPVHEVIG